MNQNIAPESFRSCRCGVSLLGIQRDIQSARPSVTLLLDLIEKLTDTFQRSSRCDRECVLIPEYIQTLIDSIALLLDLLEGMAHEFLAGNCRTDGFANDQRIATVDRFVLDEGERKLLLREILRGAVMNINHLAREIHYRRSAWSMNIHS